eukprot:5762833-Pyramimonas_sp.AAC.1
MTTQGPRRPAHWPVRGSGAPVRNSKGWQVMRMNAKQTDRNVMQSRKAQSNAKPRMSCCSGSQRGT